MNAKKLIVTLAAALMLTGASASAAKTEKVIIPDYECLINDASVYYADSVYPLISFRNITYFPMTYEYCRALGLTSQWVEGKGLYIAYSPSSQNTLPVYGTQNNSKTDKAVIPDYPIYINGKITAENKVIIKIRDKGCGIPDIKKAMEPLFTTAPEEDRAGLGFAVMQSFCDKVSVRSKPDSGTTVTLEKIIGSENDR